MKFTEPSTWFFLVFALIGNTILFMREKVAVQRLGLNYEQSYPVDGPVTILCQASIHLSLTVVLFSQRGNYWPSAIYTLIISAMGVRLYQIADKKSALEISVLDIVAVATMIISVIIWGLVHPGVSTVILPFALWCIGFPRVCAVAKNRNAEFPPVAYLFIISNIGALCMGKDWSVNERLVPVMGILYWATIAVLAMRQEKSCSPSTTTVAGTNP